MSERERMIRILVSGGKFPISAGDALYLIGVIDVIREDRNRLRVRADADPDLLEALKRILPAAADSKHHNFSDLSGNEDCLRDMLRCALAAIAKAEEPAE